MRLEAAGNHTIHDAGGDPQGWRYRLTINGPSATNSGLYGAEGLNRMRGKVVARLVQRDSFDFMGDGRTPNKTWASTHRLGADPLAALIELRGQSYVQALALCGIPPEMVTGLGQGTAAREAQRRWMNTGLDALGRVAAAELRAKLIAPINLNFDTLANTDIAARARSYKPLVEACIDADEAKRLTGLDQTPCLGALVGVLYFLVSRKRVLLPDESWEEPA